MERVWLINTEPRIIRQQTQADWNRVWENLHSAPVPEQMKAAWYHIIHDLVPTKSRLAAIQLSASPQCDSCNKLDTIIHRLTNRSNSARIWRWTSARLAMMLRIDTRHIPAEWTTPDFHLWHPQRHQAILWTIAHLVGFLDNNRILTLEDCMDYLRRVRWKLYNRPRQRAAVRK